MSLWKESLKQAVDDVNKDVIPILQWVGWAMVIIMALVWPFYLAEFLYAPVEREDIWKVSLVMVIPWLIQGWLIVVAIRALQLRRQKQAEMQAFMEGSDG